MTLRIGSRAAQTDATGRFLLARLLPGSAVLIVDGRTANTTEQSYGTHEIAVTILEGGTNVLPFRIWMTLLDEENAATIEGARRPHPHGHGIGSGGGGRRRHAQVLLRCVGRRREHCLAHGIDG